MPSKEEVAAIKHLRAKYPFIVAWGRYCGQSEAEINEDCASANQLQLAETACYCALNPVTKLEVWVYLDELSNEKLKQYLKNAVAKGEYKY